MKIYLIRHGETNLNKKRVLQGWTDSELNECGIELAKKTAEGLKNVVFDVVFTSPLKRARKTAQIVARVAETGIPVIEEPRIQEICFGEYEGLSYLKEDYTIPDKEFMNFFRAPERFLPPHKGESLPEVIERTGAFVKELLENPAYKEKTVLLSTHGCALKAILANIRQTPLKDFWGDGVHKNCAVTIVEVKNKVATVLEEGKVYY